jgi:hypothetical protein
MAEELMEDGMTEKGTPEHDTFPKSGPGLEQ